MRCSFGLVCSRQARPVARSSHVGAPNLEFATFWRKQTHCESFGLHFHANSLDTSLFRLTRFKLRPRSFKQPSYCASPHFHNSTMAEYAKKKNDELVALLKERGLPHSGKKADLVKRLEDYDASGVVGSVKPVADDEIDWDDEPAADAAKSATTQPAAEAIAAGGVGVEVPNPQAVPNQIVAEDPSQANDLDVAAVGETKPELEEEKVPEKDFSQGLMDRTIDEEIEKRKARARKFGMPEDTDDIKALERAKRFGTADLPGLLNKALPSERKRGRDGGDGADGVRKRSRGPQRGGRHGRGPRREKERTPVSTGGSGGGSYPSWMTKEDREKADARKAKFAAS